MAQIMIHNTNGKENVERASLAFVAANVALSAGQEAVVLLTIEGVRLATRGYADGLQADGFSPLRELISQFVTMTVACGSVGLRQTPEFRRFAPDPSVAWPGSEAGLAGDAGQVAPIVLQ
jgi:hypothetical protein